MATQKQGRVRISLLVYLTIILAALALWVTSNVAMLSAIILPAHVAERSVTSVTTGTNTISHKLVHYLFFNGNYSYGLIPASQKLNVRQFSVAFWARSDGPPHGSFDRPLQMLQWINTRGVSTPYGWAFDADNQTIVGIDKLRFTVGSTTGNLFITNPPVTVPRNTWTHIVGTFDGKNIELYQNGALVSTSPPLTGSYSYPNPPVPIQLAVGWQPHHYWTGDLSDIRIYNRAISLPEISSLFQDHDISNGLVGHWMLNEGSGNLIHDSSGNGDNGMIHNPIWRSQQGGIRGTVTEIPTVIKELPRSYTTTIGTETMHKNDWITANHDIFGTRNSNQTIIGKNNVNKLQVKWILHSDFTIENPPLIVGDRGYVQDNGMRVMAFDVNTGLNVWNFDPNSAPAIGAHGLTYDNGIIFAGTGRNATVVAVNATDGKLIWQSVPVGPPAPISDPTQGYSTPGPPTVWKDIVIVGDAIGDTPGIQGKVTAFNRANGEKIWSIQTTTGPWVEGKNATINGGAATWNGGSLDTKTGIYYSTTANPSPDLNDATRPGPNLWADSILALDVKTGHLIWGKQILKHDTRDWDAGWGNSLATVRDKKVVIGETKRGDAYALDATNGTIVWKLTPPIMPNVAAAAYTANDNKTAYFAVTATNGMPNGTVTAVDIKTGKIKWVYPTDSPSVSPAVTNGVIFSGHIITPVYDWPTLNPSGMIFALDKETGKKLWQFNVGAPIGIGGPSIGHGMLFVTTGSPNLFPLSKGGEIIAFGLPSENQTQ